MRLPVIAVAGCLAVMSSAGSAGGTAQQPVIAGYGKITPVEGAVERRTAPCAIGYCSA
jgi:hypothetical protein